MSDYSDTDGMYPIDVIEQLAAHHEWDFNRISKEQIAMSVEGQWRAYSITVAWSANDETLRLICTFELEPPNEKIPDLFELLNSINNQCWADAFAYWGEQKLMVYRYGLILNGDAEASPDQINTMIRAALMSAERYYPAPQLLVWGDKNPEQALQVAICEAYGHA